MFEIIWNNSLKSYGFYNVPGLSWDGMLKMTNNELELIPDPDMYVFFEKGSRSAIS